MKRDLVWWVRPILSTCLLLDSVLLLINRIHGNIEICADTCVRATAMLKSLPVHRVFWYLSLLWGLNVTDVGFW